jgi:regulator of protease activity HflC (stomatin/prohibitin superfamily)
MRTIVVTPFYTLKPFERGIRETLGKYTGFVHPGLGLLFPFFQIVRVRDVREHTMSIPPQMVITHDNVELKVDGIMWVRPATDEESIKRTFYNIDNWKNAIVQLAITNLRQEFGNLTLDESLIAREKIAHNLQAILTKYSVEWGLSVSKVEIMLIDPPDDIKKAMHLQKTAEQERRSMRLLATGEFEAAQQKKLAAIERAEGERVAAVKVAEGKAEAIRLVNEAAEKYFTGNAQILKKIEMVETSLKDNAKVIVTDKGINPTLFLGDMPVKVGDKDPDGLKNGR